MRRRGRRTVAALLLALAGGSTLPAHGAQPCPGVSVSGSWKTITTPVKTDAYTIDAAGRLYVAGAGGMSVSEDGGCTWRQSHALDALLSPGERVTALATVGRTVVAAVTGPYALVTSDGGAAWTRHDAGFDVPGDPVGLYPGPGANVYMLVRQRVTDQALSAAGLGEQGVGATVSVVYRSADGGRTWARGEGTGTSFSGPHGSELGGGSAPGEVWDLAVDSTDADHVLAAADDGVFRTVDGGDTWTGVLFVPGAHMRAVSMWRTGAGAAAVAVDPSTGALYTAPDASGRWAMSDHPQLRTEMMTTYPYAAAWAWTAAYAGDVVVTGPKGVFRVASGRPVDVTPPGAGGARGTVVEPRILPAPEGPALWARLFDGSALLTEVPRRPQHPGHSTSTVTTPGGAAGETEWSGRVETPDVAETSARLTGSVPRVELAPGESRTIPFEAVLGPRQIDVDLYFVVDTTSSMSNTIRSLLGGMHEIVTRLARSGIRLRAGVGAFRSYPQESDRVVVDYPYRRLRALGPVDEGLVEALYELEGGGVSGANLTAIVQSVTGAGQDVLPPGPSKADIAPGLEAGFRDHALRVVVHVGDTWFGTPERGDPNGYYAPGTWPGPTPEETAAVLRQAGVVHLGIAIQPGEGGTAFADADVVEDMKALSRASSSLAGERGADCDGDGRPDLEPGEPLVCLLHRRAGGGGTAAVVTGLVEALEERGDVRLAELGESGVVREITPSVHPGVDLRARQSLSFDVTVACTVEDAGTRRTVDLALFAGEDEAARAALAVSCAELPLAVAPRAPERAAPALALVPPIPVPPPPHPVPGPGPGSVTAPAPVQAPAPAQAPGGQPQTTPVAQRQQQPQAALAAVQVREQTQMQHALVRTTARDPLAAARLWTAVGGLTIVWAWAIAAATVTSVRRARG